MKINIQRVINNLKEGKGTLLTCGLVCPIHKGFHTLLTAPSSGWQCRHGFTNKVRIHAQVFRYRPLCTPMSYSSTLVFHVRDLSTRKAQWFARLLHMVPNWSDQSNFCCYLPTHYSVSSYSFPCGMYFNLCLSSLFSCVCCLSSCRV